MSIRPLSPELAEKARVELGEDSKTLKDDLQHLKDWIAKQPHLRARTDDQWLIAFLRGCKFSLERTKEKIDLYYSIRTTAPELFALSHNDPAFKEIFETGAYLPLPKTATPDSPRVFLFKPGACDPNKHKMLEQMNVVNIFQKLLFIDDDNTVVAGQQTILDLDAVTMGHFLQMTPMNMKKMVTFGQDASPLRTKGTHYLNTPNGFETVFNAMKSLLNEKNKSRLYVHNKNYEEMYKFIPKNILPSEYGGDGGSLEEIKDYWRKKIQEYSSWLEEDKQFGTDESKRPGKPKTAESMFGLEGSFRQLQFD